MKSDSLGVSFVYRPGEFTLKDQGDFQTVEFTDADHCAFFGEYDLPAKVVRLGLPQTGAVKVKFSARNPRTVEKVSLARVSYPDLPLPGEPEGANAPVSCRREDGAEEVPDSLVRVDQGVSLLRGVRVLFLKLYPAQYRPAEKRLTVFEEIYVQVDFERPGVKAVEKPDPLDRALEALLLNGIEAKGWRVAAASPSFKNPYSRSSNWVKVKVAVTGIYRITGEELARAGVPLSGLDPRTLALYTLGEHQPNLSYPDTLRPCAIYLTGDADGRFDPTDTLIFYGVAPDHWMPGDSVWVKNLYTRENVYWLTWGGAPGKRMRSGRGPEAPNAPVLRTGRVKLHQELDLDCPARAGLLWVEAKIFKSADAGEAKLLCPLNLEYPTAIYRISGRLYNNSADNYVTLLFNGRALGEFRFGASSYPSPYDFSFAVPFPVNFTDNTLEFQLRGTGEKRVYLDYIEVEYARRLSLYPGQCEFSVDTTGAVHFLVRDVTGTPVVLDVTDPYDPAWCAGVRLEGDSARFSRLLCGRSKFALALPEQLLRPARIELKSPGRLWQDADFTADYWIVTPAEFLGPAQELARFRTNRIPGIENARARAVNLAEIYDDFGFGLEEPGAIKRFFQVKRPVYALLVGDGTYDYRNILSREPLPGVPPFEMGYGLIPDAGDRSALALDAWYADLDGEGSTPDFILGRVTARTAEELRRFVDKVIACETRSTGYWTRRFLLLADDEYQRYPDRPDELRFRHIEQCEGIAALAGNYLDPVKLYLTEFPFVGPKSKPAANRELLRELGRGALIWVFFGHGSAYALTHEEVLTVSRLDDIQNGNRVPFCFFGSCSVGRFDDTKTECIGEELVRMSGGALATVAASTATPSGNNLLFARNLLLPLFSTPESVRTIGFCFYQAWTTDRSYHLFGDPATVVRLPQSSGASLAITPDTIRAGSVVRARAQMEVLRGDAEWRLFGPKRLRYYQSPVGITTYFLPGVEVARGGFRVKDGRFYCAGVFPLGIPLDTVFVGNGFYAPLAGSGVFSAQVKGDTVNLGLLAANLKFGSGLVGSTDVTGPEVEFYCAGAPVRDTAFLPPQAELQAVLRDPSGILIAPVPGSTPCFYINQPLGAVDIGDLIQFDDSSYTVARVRLPLSLKGPVDSLFLAVSDNYLNRTVERLILKPQHSTVLTVESVLVYPNPVKRHAYFTFTTNMSSTVRVRIYTLSGKLVRDLGERPVPPGYNQILWDGRSEDGELLPNGVYLFSIRAQTVFEPAKRSTVVVRDKFLILR